MLVVLPHGMDVLGYTAYRSAECSAAVGLSVLFLHGLSLTTSLSFYLAFLLMPPAAPLLFASAARIAFLAYRPVQIGLLGR
jgi:hypothetical protein